LITALLRYGLKAHDYGLLTLEPTSTAVTDSMEGAA